MTKARSALLWAFFIVCVMPIPSDSLEPAEQTSLSPLASPNADAPAADAAASADESAKDSKLKDVSDDLSADSSAPSEVAAADDETPTAGLSPLQTNLMRRYQAAQASDGADFSDQDLKALVAEVDKMADDADAMADETDEPELTAAEEAADEAANAADSADASRLAAKKWSSCADDCKGEGEIVSVLKKGRPTPKCCVDLLYDTTTYVDRLLTRNGITYWAMKGTLLGVVRDKGIIPHDYDIDLAILHEEINKVASLREQIWKDGYVLFQAPWPGYNNMNFVIAKRTKVVQEYFDKNPHKPIDRPKFAKSVRDKLVAAELMVFKKTNGMLVQVLCTAPSKEDPKLYDGKVNPNLWKEFQDDFQAYKARAKTVVNGWLKYADANDKPFVNSRRKFDHKNMSKYCEHTAPASFKYDAPAKWVLPPKRGQYYSKTLSVPRDAHRYARSYFGDDYMTPKRRYDK